MAQKGCLYESHGSWFIKYWIKVEQPDGAIKRHQETHRLGSKADYPKKSEVEDLQQEFMAQMRRVGLNPSAGVNLVDFVENKYFPAVQRRLAPSTLAGYKKAWNKHLKHRLESFRVRDFRAVDGQKLMDAIGDEHGNKLSHQSYRWLKVTMSAIFTHSKAW